MRYARPEFEHLKTAAEVRHWADVSDANHGDAGLSALARQHALDLESTQAVAPHEQAFATPRLDEFPVDEAALLADDPQPAIDPVTHRRRGKGA